MKTTKKLEKMQINEYERKKDFIKMGITKIQEINTQNESKKLSNVLKRMAKVSSQEWMLIRIRTIKLL